MTKSELKTMIRKMLKEELKSCRLTEGHTTDDLGKGYYADVNDDQYEDGRDPKDVEVYIYKRTGNYPDPRRDKYITTVNTFDEAQEYVDSLPEERVEPEPLLFKVKLQRALTAKCPKCGKTVDVPEKCQRGYYSFPCTNCGYRMRITYTPTCKNCGKPMYRISDSDVIAMQHNSVYGDHCKECGTVHHFTMVS
jgi:RNase P subunit RPR2